MKGIGVRVFTSVKDFTSQSWESNFELPFPLSYNFLKVVEESRLNLEKAFYIQLYDEDGELARANIFISETDFATFDSNLPKHYLHAIKQWYPEMLKFRVLESSFFTWLGEGLHVRRPEDFQRVLPAFMDVFHEIGEKEKVDLHLIRDVSQGSYPHYIKELRPRGYYPAPGFPNTTMDLPWNTFDEYLGSLNHRYRYAVKSVFKEQERLGITHVITNRYEEHLDRIEELVMNTYRNAKDYQREILNKAYFQKFSEYWPEKSEAILQFYQGKLIAVCFNIHHGSTYSLLDFGIDDEDERIKLASPWKASAYYGLERAIALGKKKIELGVTNYFPKMALGCRCEPYVYFFKHVKAPVFSKVLANVMAESIKTPDNTAVHVFKENLHSDESLEAYNLRIKSDREDLEDSDILKKVSNYHKFNALKLSDLYSYYPAFAGAQSSSIPFGKDAKVVLLGTNSYLGMASHPRVVEEAVEALKKYGTGCSGSPLLNGTLDIHVKLEEELSEFMGRESTIICSTGFQTNLAGISALCEAGDLCILDERSHRSLFDAVRLSGADYVVYRHGDTAHLGKILSKTGGRRRVVVTDSVFSMEGTLPDLKEIARLAKLHKVALFVDEAHGVGIFGKRGRGVCELLGIEGQVDLIMGTFSKSFASVGGFISGKREIIDYIKHKGSAHIFSASIPPSCVATVRAILKLIKDDPQTRESILEKAKFMGDGLERLGYNARFKGTQIVPVVFGNHMFSMAAFKKFLDMGVFVNPIGPPAIPESEAGFRTSYIANHDWKDLDYALDVFEKLKSEILCRGLDAAVA